MGSAAAFFTDDGDAQRCESSADDLVAGLVRIGHRGSVSLVFDFDFCLGQFGQLCGGGPDHT